MSNSNVFLLLFGVITLVSCLSMPMLSTNDHMSEGIYRRVEDWQTGKPSVETKLFDSLTFSTGICASDVQEGILYYTIYNRGKFTCELDGVDTKTGSIKVQKRLAHSLDSMDFDVVSKQIYALTYTGQEHPDKLMLVDPSTGSSRTVVELPAGWRRANNHGNGKYSALSQTNYEIIALGTREGGGVHEWLNIDLKTKHITVTKTNYTSEVRPGNFVFNQTTNALYGILRYGEEAYVVELDARSGQVNRKIASIGEQSVYTGFIAENVFYLACQKPEKFPTPFVFITVDLTTGAVKKGSEISYVPVCIRP